ncbi:hypothetical protein [Spirosoma fluviale]|uniref:Uncharacterized protein n=1 Tax=Spirosoma fluviale TaxID=1597977 RepID=A0A286GS31_9BACT|nr:hypothetical protein [Spirosoma fluviale]SOD98343.1 hypothetical protein SAMN06269250_6035 [Spirosoma fluviale]
MKKTYRYSKLFMAGLLLASVMYNCKTKDVESLTPFTYTFTKFNDVKLPTISPTTPAVVTVVDASVTNTSAYGILTPDVLQVPVTGVVLPVIKQAAVDVNKAISTTAAAALSDKFTPEVIDAMVTTGFIPANLAAELTLLSNSPSLLAYMPILKLPTIDGKEVGGRVGAVTGTNIAETVSVAKATLDDDACKDAAQKAYDLALPNLTSARDIQLKAVNDLYILAQTTQNSSVKDCRTGASAKFAALNNTARGSLSGVEKALKDGRAILGEETYTFLRLLYLTQFKNFQDDLKAAEKAQTESCDLSADARLAAAKVALEKDLEKVNDNFKAAKKELDGVLSAAVTACHNQGNGG